MLPLSRNTTATAAAPVKSVDFNDLQDCVIGAKHGEVVDIIHPFAMALGANVAKNPAGYLAFSGAGDAHIVECIRTGTRITSVMLRIYGNGATTFAVNAWIMDASATLTNIGPGAAAVTATPAAAWTDLVVDVTDTTLAAGESLWISVETDGGGARLGNVSITNHRP